MSAVLAAALLALTPAHPEAAAPSRVIRIGIADSRGKVKEIRSLDLEEYLLGVLPNEMDPSWPHAALRAQAVVARTFAYAQLGKHRAEGFDLTSDTRSQVYIPPKSTAPSVSEAVRGTRGEVLGYGGELLSVYYHSTCGGRTTDPREVWKSGSPTPRPLRGVKDRYCSPSPHYHWTAYFADDDILAALARSGSPVGPLRSLRIGSRDKAGFARDFRILLGSGETRVGANELRSLLGGAELKSARILRIFRRGKGVEFHGRGNGHGVGLCQWGARVMAQKGRSYESILRHYFPGAVMSVVTE